MAVIGSPLVPMWFRILLVLGVLLGVGVRGQATDFDGEAVAEELARGLAHDDPWVRREAIRRLAFVISRIDEWEDSVSSRAGTIMHWLGPRAAACAMDVLRERVTQGSYGAMGALQAMGPVARPALDAIAAQVDARPWPVLDAVVAIDRDDGRVAARTLARVLERHRHRVRWHEIEEFAVLGNAGRPVIPLLRRELEPTAKEPHYEIDRIVRVLIAFGDDRDELTKRLGRLVRRWPLPRVVEAFHDADPAGFRALPHLLATLKRVAVDENATDASARAATLLTANGRRHLDRVVPALLASLQRPGYDRIVDPAVWAALAQLGTSMEDALPALLAEARKMLPAERPPPHVAWALASTDPTGRAVVPVLRKMLDNEWEYFRAGDGAAIGAMDTRVAVPLLAPLLGPDDDRAYSALASLGSVGRLPAAQRAAVIEYLAHEDDTFAQRAAWVLHVVREPVPEPASELVRSATRAAVDAKTLYAIHALARLTREQRFDGREVLRRLLTSPRNRVRAHVALAMMQLGPRAHDLLADLERATTGGVKAASERERIHLGATPYMDAWPQAREDAELFDQWAKWALGDLSPEGTRENDYATIVLPHRVDPDLPSRGWWTDEGGRFESPNTTRRLVSGVTSTGSVTFHPVLQPGCVRGGHLSCEIMLRPARDGTPRIRARVGYWLRGRVTPVRTRGRVTINTDDWTRPGRIRGVYEIEGRYRAGFDLDNPFVR